MNSDIVRRYIESYAKSTAEGLVKFRVEGVPAEWLWAEPVNGRDDLLKVRNIPFFCDLGKNDIVQVEIRREDSNLGVHREDGERVEVRNLEDGFLHFVGLVERATWTLRVVYDVEGCDDDEISRRHKEIVDSSELDCEGAYPGFMVMSVPVEKVNDDFWGDLEERLDGTCVEQVFIPEC